MLKGKDVTILRRTEKGTYTSVTHHIDKVVISDNTRYYAYHNIVTGETGLALKSVYDKLFTPEKKNVHPLHYKGENANSRIRMTEGLTVKERKWKKNSRHGS